MIIDSHTHVLNDKSYKQYLEKTEGKIEKILALAFFFQDMEELWQFASTKENLFLVGSIDMKNNIHHQLESSERMLKEKKIWGIKLYPGYQYFYPSDKEVFPIAQLCQKYNKPLIFHSGDFYDVRGETYKAMLKYSHPIHIDELASRFHECKIIISHFGFPFMLESALLASKHKNVFLDLSGTIDSASNQSNLKKMVKRYLNDLKRIYDYYPDIRQKTLFGTDFIGNDTKLCEIKPYLDLVSQIFSKKERPQILGKLAEKLFFS